MGMLRAGQLRKRVTVQTRASTQDAIGGQVTTWADLATIWAGVAALSGRELELARMLAAEVTHEITCRYQAIFALPKTVATYRITYAGRVFNIHAMQNDDERNRVVILQCSEGLSDG